METKKKIKFIGIFIILYSLISYTQVFAADLSPGQEPGAQAERYKLDVDKEKERLEYKKTKAPEIKIEEEKVAPKEAGVSFELKGIRVTGSTIFKQEDFQQIYEPYLGKKVTFSDLDAISKKIESKYKEKGYFTTSVYIPEQDIKDGVIEIRIAEGKMGKINVEGNKWFSSIFIKKFFHVEENEILNIKTLARDILRLNKNPDLEIKAIISQGKELQTSDIALKVKDKFPWHTGFLEDNRGSRLTGKYRSMFFIRSSNASGLGDTVFFNTLYSGKSFAESVSYSIPIGTYGTKFGLDITYFKMKLGKEYKPSDITGNTQIYTPYFSWELALVEDFQAYADLGLNIKAIKKEQDSDPTSKDQLRIPYFGFNFLKTDHQGQTSFSPRFNFGTSGFLFKYEQSLSRIQRMLLGSYMSIRTQLQLASRTLASSEQFQLGGADSVRGYPEGDYLADNAGCVNFDWFFPLRRQIEPVLFVDLGGGKLKKTLSGERDDKFLAGVGAGVRLNFKLFSLRLDWAKGVGDKQTSGSGPSTFYFTFRSEI